MKECYFFGQNRYSPNMLSPKWIEIEENRQKSLITNLKKKNKSKNVWFCSLVKCPRCPAIISSTGYWPCGTGARSSMKLYFNGGVDNYELWQVKFLGQMQLQKLSKVFEEDESNVCADDNAYAFVEFIVY